MGAFGALRALRELSKRHAKLRPSVPAFLGFQRSYGPGLAHPSNTNAQWSPGAVSDPAPKSSSGLQRVQGHPLSLALGRRCGCCGFNLLSRKLTCNKVAPSPLRQTRKRCTLHKEKTSHIYNRHRALEALCGSFSCAVCRRAESSASRVRPLTR